MLNVPYRIFGTNGLGSSHCSDITKGNEYGYASKLQI